MWLIIFLALTFGRSYSYASSENFIVRHTKFNITDVNQTIIIAEEACDTRLDYLRQQLTKPAKVVSLTGPIVSFFLRSSF